MLGRCVLLALTTLSACAASTPPGSGGSDPSGVAGAYGSFLVGQYAASRFDFPVAASAMRNALADDPAAASQSGGRNFSARASRRQYRHRERPRDRRAAGSAGPASAGGFGGAGRSLAGGAAPLSVAADAGRADRHHEAAAGGLGAAGRGQTSAALASLQTNTNRPGLRTIFALHTALIADQAKLVATAAQNYGIVQGSLDVTNLRLAELLASWDARTGDLTGADQVLDGLSPDLALAMTVPAIKKRLMTPPVPNAVDGLAEVYRQPRRRLPGRGGE